MFTPDASPPESGPLSVNQAVELLAEGQHESGGADDDEEPPPEAETAHFWLVENKMTFAELPPHLQERTAACAGVRGMSPDRSGGPNVEVGGEPG